MAVRGRNQRGLVKGCDLDEFQCAVCGKTVCTPDISRWAYKSQTGRREKKYYCCSWSCLQKVPAMNVRGRKSGKGDEIMKLLREGKGESEIAFEVGVNSGTVKYWKNKMIDREEIKV